MSRIIPSLLAFCFSTGALAGDGRAAAIAAAHKAIEHRLKDPASAQYRGELAFQGPNDPSAWFVCGEVNAKNAYGGYVGFKPYYFTTGTDGATVREEGADEVFDMMFKALCVDGAARAAAAATTSP